MTPPQDLSLPEGWQCEPDAQALFAHGERLEQRARQLLAEAHQAAAELQAQALFDLSARAGCVDGLLARARLAIADGSSFGRAQNLLAEAGRQSVEQSRPAVVVAVDVLGPGLSLAGPDGEVDRSPTFTVISPFPEQAAATLERVSDQLMAVDEHGRYHQPDELDHLDRGESYTPNYITPVQISDYGARVSLDTKGVMWSAMGRTMVRLIVEALAGDGVPAVVAGDVETLTATSSTGLETPAAPRRSKPVVKERACRHERAVCWERPGRILMRALCASGRVRRGRRAGGTRAGPWVA